MSKVFSIISDDFVCMALLCPHILDQCELFLKRRKLHLINYTMRRYIHFTCVQIMRCVL